MLKNPDVKNVNKSKNRLTSVKLGSKKQDKKALASREDSGGKFPSDIRMKPRPIYYGNLYQLYKPKHGTSLSEYDHL